MATVAAEPLKLSKKQTERIIHDAEKSAKAVNLVYVSDTLPGITRRKAGEKFQYFFEDKQISDDEDLLRIKHLVIPPAWTNVWICPKDNCHLQATGFDVKNRKQYRYHPEWNKVRSHTKFYRLLDFGKVLPGIRKQLNKDLSLQDLPLNKVLAAVVSLMERTSIRVGNNMYEKLY
ncbi:MAG: DNA topoisomerase IB, partial [Ginsengibacter sp.]